MEALLHGFIIIACRPAGRGGRGGNACLLSLVCAERLAEMMLWYACIHHLRQSWAL